MPGAMSIEAWFNCINPLGEDGRRRMNRRRLRNLYLHPSKRPNDAVKWLVRSSVLELRATIELNLASAGRFQESHPTIAGPEPREPTQQHPAEQPSERFLPFDRR